MEFEHAERELAERLGVRQEVLKRIRKRRMKRGTHFDLVKGAIRYAEAGVAIVQQELGAGGAKKGAPRGEEQAVRDDRRWRRVFLLPRRAESLRARVERVAVFKKTFRNPHIIQCECQGELIRVRVRDNRNFRKGMEVPCRQVKGDLYELTRRCPRWPGRW